ncbi:regulator of microtubule dynamics protein 2-like [Tropilaelaps mercedesae]|uniref:Regulator of microtubule dynamics protein 1 n=1 Tax=Tropilaelaps mercedesae TaxID=418985 RepID=A0A1V9XE02_9ACAR|nr:regulator of microtubule dynamics protein 2-like [Tropilaelaps mercedesae]
MRCRYISGRDLRDFPLAFVPSDDRPRGYFRLNKTVNREISQLAGTIDDLRRELSDLREREELLEAATQGQPPIKRSASSISRTGSGRNRPLSSQKLQKARDGSALSSSTLASEGVMTPSEVKLLNGVLSDDDDEEYFDFPDSERDDGASADQPPRAGGGESMASLEADDDDRWLAAIDVRLDDATTDKEEIYFELKFKKGDYAGSADFYWRLTKATHFAGIVAQSAGDIGKKRELAFEAHKYAVEALKIDEHNPECHKWFAIAVGSLSEFVGTQQKIQNGYQFKKHVDIAVKLKPLDPTLYHMLGRWCYEVAQLSWVERKLASTLYSTPPESTLEEARAHLFEADKLKPHWKENMLYIAKTYIGESNYAPAISWIDRAIEVASDTDGDRVAHKQLVGLQGTYAKYRQ